MQDDPIPPPAGGARGDEWERRVQNAVLLVVAAPQMSVGRSVASIAETFGISYEDVSAAASALVELGLITRDGDRLLPSQMPNG